MQYEDIVGRYFAAMRRGAAAEEELVKLFDQDAVYTEPFSSALPAVGIDAIRDRLRKGWETPLPDLQLEVLSIEVDRDAARATWECRSPALPGPMVGEDRYQFRDGRIIRLDVRLVDAG